MLNQKQLEAGLQAGAFGAEVLTLILLLLAFIPLIGIVTALIIGLYAQLIVIGYAAVHAAFLAFDWDELTCKIYVVLNAEGLLSASGLAALRADIASSYTADQQTVLLGILDYVGFGGMNDAASTYSETGDCAACPNTWAYDILPGDTDYWDWNYHAPYLCSGALGDGGILAGAVIDVAGVLKWEPWRVPTEYAGLQFRVPIGDQTTVTRVLLGRHKIGGSANWDAYLNNMVVQETTRCHQGAFLPSSVYDWTGLGYTNTVLNIVMRYQAASPQQSLIDYLHLEGTGVNPFL